MTPAEAESRNQPAARDRRADRSYAGGPGNRDHAGSIAAAAAADVALLLTLIAEQTEPEPDELAAIAAIEGEPPDHQTLTVLRR